MEYIVVGVVAAAAVTILDDDDDENGEGRGVVPCDDENVENNSGSANVFFLVFFVSW